MRGVRPALLAAALVTLARAPAASAAAPGDLEWDAPPDCVRAASVSRDIEQALAASPAGRERVRARAVVSRTAANRWHVEVTLRSNGEQAQRAFDGPTCAAVVDAAALVITLALNPQAHWSASRDAARDESILRVSTEPRPESRSEPPSRPAPTPSETPIKPSAPPGDLHPAADTERPSAAGSPRSISGSPVVGVGATADFGTLPRGVVGVEITLALQANRLRGELAGSYFTPSRQTVASRDDVGATFYLGATNLRFCYDLLRGPFSFGPCADIGLTFTSAAGFGPIVTFDRVNSTVATMGGDLTARWRVSRSLSTHFQAGALAPLARPEFAVQGLGEIHRAAAVTIRGAAGLEMRFD